MKNYKKNEKNKSDEKKEIEIEKINKNKKTK